MIEVGNTVEYMGDHPEFKNGTKVKVLEVRETTIRIPPRFGIDGGWWLTRLFKKVKGAEMNNIEQLKKEHKEMGETIKRMEEASKPKAEWSWEDIVRSRKCTKDHRAFWRIVDIYSEYNMVTEHGHLAFREALPVAQMVDYLNKEGYTKA